MADQSVQSTTSRFHGPDVKDKDGNILVTAYAFERPDDQWSVMLINKDKDNNHSVKVSFSGTAAGTGVEPDRVVMMRHAMHRAWRRHNRRSTLSYCTELTPLPMPWAMFEPAGIPIKATPPTLPSPTVNTCPRLFSSARTASPILELTERLPNLGLDCPNELV